MWLKQGAVLLLCIKNILGSLCDLEETCDTCIFFEIERCIWCPAKTHNSSRCQSKNRAKKIKDWCFGEVVDPQSKIEFFEEENNLSVSSQFTPNHFIIKSRPKETVNFTMIYKPIVYQSLDIYILIDNSMNRLKTELGKIIKDLHQNLTGEIDVHFGIGSFTEQPAKPYILSESDIYSYKNELKLGMNISEFIEILNLIKTENNVKNQGGGLDALMQAMVCNEDIGWRTEARRMVIYCSDQGFHTAGDGKMIGILKPNDMKCHLKNNVHDAPLKYDYPSIGQLNKIAHDKEITIVFVLKSQVNIIKLFYEKISKSIEAAQFVSMTDEKEIADKIVNEYKKMKNNLFFTYNKVPNVILGLDPDCSQKNNEECNIEFKENVTVNAHLTLNKCETNEYKETIILKPFGLPFSDKLQVDIEGWCNCDCENIRVHNASECNDHGTNKCGICECNEGRFGENCEYDSHDQNKFETKCKNEFCSQRGICKWGRCQCDKGYAGENCEFSDFSCKFYKGKICAGNGICSKSQCICDDGWINEDCSCSTSIAACYSNEKSEICSNNGECICNQCECARGYSGPLCDYCANCAEKTCKDLEEYATCVFTKTKNFCDKQLFYITKDVDTKLISREEMRMNSKKALICKKNYDNGSEMVYMYQENSKKWMLFIQNTLEAPVKPNVFALVAATIGSVIIGGLIIILIWKYTVQYLDRKEYLKFEAEVKSNVLNATQQNPLYINPIVKFQNPRYRQDSNT